MHTLLIMGRYYGVTMEHVSKIVSILLSKLSDCPNTDTSLCYCNNPFLAVYNYGIGEFDQNNESVPITISQDPVYSLADRLVRAERKNV